LAYTYHRNYSNSKVDFTSGRSYSVPNWYYSRMGTLVWSFLNG